VVKRTRIRKGDLVKVRNENSGDLYLVAYTVDCDGDENLVKLYDHQGNLRPLGSSMFYKVSAIELLGSR
jgi:hypothetical protein